ncbi:MAG: radical SAM protein [Lachnospiraceae bacterium]|nr:radical SAM protein [Lachnospiraceae bacterium]
MHYITTKGILSAKNEMNLYRGCSHGCVYCDSRSKCYNMTHDFEDIEVKENALVLLEAALKHKRKKCMIGTGAMTDPYIPLELQLEHVRKSLKLIYEYGFGFTVLTKSSRILRDIDLLQKINEKTKCVVQMTLTTYEDDLCRKIEPNVSPTSERVKTLQALRDAGIPTVVWLSPILPFINDTAENISGILDLCRDAQVYGIICFGMGLTLREGNREYFYAQLDRLFPQMKERYIKTYGNQYIINSPNHSTLMKLFHQTCSEYGMIHDNEQLFHYLSVFEEKQKARQLSLWDI